MRIGIGYDIHPLVEGRPLFLGGIEIPFEKGLSGHSDGDALIHAIGDAILGALSEEDIGRYFPDTDPSLKGMRSDAILARASELLRHRGFFIVNIDAVVAAEEPKIAPFRGAMKEHLAAVLGIDPGSISIKGKRGEGLGVVGRREGIEVYAVALLQSTGENL
jgi:2-C-methyl-D-erythritol 2,4-cyclodiphosphate synthase